MNPWVPNRLMQTAMVLCLVACASVVWIASSQPWLGLSLAADNATGAVWIARADPRGPARAVPVPARLVSAAGPDGQGRIALGAVDVIEEPDLIETYGELRDFLRRQSHLAVLLRGAAVVLGIEAEGGARSTVTVVPAASAPVRRLPADFWVQLVTGAGAFLIGTWVWALRPRDLGTRMFALSSLMLKLSAFSAAIYGTRELAIDGGLLRALSALNHLGALGFGCAMLVLFLYYPRRLVRLGTLWLIPALFGAWLLSDILRLAPSPALGSQLPTATLMLAIIVAILVQWHVNRDDPRARAALRWLGLSVAIGAGAFVVLIIAPILAEGVPPMRQGYAFGFFLLIYIGLALGLSRYRLFELDDWAFRIMFFTVGAVLLAVVDAALIVLLQLRPGASFGIALLAVGFGYMPLRDLLWRRVTGTRRPQGDEQFRGVIEVAFTASAAERAERWRGLMQRLFDPLTMEAAGRPVAAPEVEAEGLELVMPAAAGSVPLRLRYPWRGRGLFSPRDLGLAREIVELMAHAEAGRSAYERGSMEERRRIARDLHDDVGARLLSGLHKNSVGDTHRTLRDAIADIRTIVSGLSSRQLPLAQVVAELRHEAGERLEAAGVDLDWPLSAADREDGMLLEYRVYRAVMSAFREMVSNVIRHAGAGRVTVRMDVAGGWLDAVMADDGTGLGGSAAPDPIGGNGLAGMVRRARELGGSVTFPDVPRGFSIRLRVPLGATPVLSGSAPAPHSDGAEPDAVR